jgi:polysaccharide biosynthesis/export protein
MQSNHSCCRDTGGGGIRRAAFLAILLLTGALLTFACSGNQQTVGQMVDKIPKADPNTMRLSPGDDVEIKFRYWPELNERQVIRPDGKITLQEVDDVQAAGLTPMELDESLTKLYETKIKNPVISVMVRAMANLRVFVNGEVVQPGAQPLRAGMTVMEAIAAAGGFNSRTGTLRRVVVVRHIGGKRYAGLIDLSKAMGENEQNDLFHLEPLDIVFVPRTRIEIVNQWVDNYINRLLPAGMTYSQTFGPGGSYPTIGYTPPGARTR